MFFKLKIAVVSLFAQEHLSVKVSNIDDKRSDLV